MNIVSGLQYFKELSCTTKIRIKFELSNIIATIFKLFSQSLKELLQ